MNEALSERELENLRLSIHLFNNLPPHLHEILSKATADLEHQHRVAAEHEGIDDPCMPPSSLVFRKDREQPPGDGTSDPTAKFKVSTRSASGQHTAVRYSPRQVSFSTGAGYSYAHAPRTRHGDQQSDPRRARLMQINYMESLALRVPSLSEVRDDAMSKERFRISLVRLARESVTRYGADQGYAIGPRPVDFKCIGSLRNSFALPGADMDLLITTNPSQIPAELITKCPRIVAKAFLDAGIGARMMLNAKVPLIRVCEKPTENLLEALKKYWQIQAETDSLCQDSASPEFLKISLGMKCDIYLTKVLALHNTELLRCYALCDERVRVVVLFVKMWAKARAINDPRSGTLCSYGYTLMVLHYLMNMVNPGVIPNLQIMYRPSNSSKVTTVDGCDVRFFNDESAIRAGAVASTNTQSVGDLLRGFFAYYGNFEGRNSFHWARQTVSIRTRGGILSKTEKGWGTRKFDKNGVVQRNLLAIEDPFAVDHNVARTITRAGLDTMRCEFSRAHRIITRVQEIPGIGWEWRKPDGEVGEDFMAVRERTSAETTSKLGLVGVKHRVACKPETAAPFSGLDPDVLTSICPLSLEKTKLDEKRAQDLQNLTQANAKKLQEILQDQNGRAGNESDPS